MSIKLNFNQLYVFYLVAEHGGVRAASKILYISAPAVSIQIKKFEKFIGFNLFIRHNSQLKLTEKGKLIYSQAKKIFTSIKKLEEQIDEFAHKEKTAITLGYPISSSQMYLTEIIKRLGKKITNIDLQISFGTSSQIIERLENGEIDIALLSETAQRESFVKTPFAEEDIILALGAHNSFGKKHEVRASDLEGYPIILPERKSLFFEVLEKYFIKYAIKPQAVMENTLSEVAKEVIQTTQYGLFTSLEQIKYELATNKVKAIKIIDAPIVFKMCFFSLKNIEPSYAAELFLSTVNLEHFQKNMDLNENIL